MVERTAIESNVVLDNKTYHDKQAKYHQSTREPTITGEDMT
jgi:hypothetical protein